MNNRGDSCFALPDCASRCDECLSHTDDLAAEFPADESFVMAFPEQPQQVKDAEIEDKQEEDREDNEYEGVEEVFDFSADFQGAFGLMERDEAGMGVAENKQTITSPPRKVVTPPNGYSPRSVISPKVFDGSSLTDKKWQLFTLSADDASQVMGLTSLNNKNSSATRKAISLEGYSIGDEANTMDLSLDITGEEAALEAKSLEVGDAAFILRSDCKWTYAIVIDKAVVPDGRSALRFEVGADNSRKTFMEAQWGKYVRVIKTSDSTAADRNAVTTGVANDPDLFYYESSESDEDTLNDNTLNDNDHSNHKADAANYDTNLNDTDNDHSNHKADAEKETNRARPKGILRNKEDNALDRYLKSKVVERNRSEGNAGFSVKFVEFDVTDDDAESKTSDAKQASGTGQDERKDSLSRDNVEKEGKHEPVELFPATEITFPTPTEYENDVVEKECAESKDSHGSSETEGNVQEASSDDEEVEEEPKLCDNESPIRLDMDNISPALECPIGQSWNVEQILQNIAQPVFGWPTEGDSASTSLKDADVPEKDDVVEKSLTIECVLQNANDVKVHEVYVSQKIDVGKKSLPASDTIQSANDLSLLKRDALNIHKRKGAVRITMRSVPTLTKQEKSLKSKVLEKTISRVRSLKKGRKVDLDELNITVDTINSYEVQL